MVDLSSEEIKKQVAELEAEIQAVDFWRDKSRAQEVLKELNRLKADLVGNGVYDELNAILSILAGAGGDDAEDWARMLFEMYQRFAVKTGWATMLIHQNVNDHGGFRNATFLIKGRGAYGRLKNESGVHRLVRLSPFSAKKLRHTSFALVEVVPDLPPETDIKISPAELKIDFFRSSGPGGQNVNKRETAVRLTHLPTGLTASSDAERSQERNRERALAVLKGKLYRLKEEEHARIKQGLQVSKTREIAWGNQIRSYVLHPYKLIKDHRSGVESYDPDAVLGGDLVPFLKPQT